LQKEKERKKLRGDVIDKDDKAAAPKFNSAERHSGEKSELRTLLLTANERQGRTAGS
jgi:hypothetical protein